MSFKSTWMRQLLTPGWICQWDSCGQRFTNMDAFKAHISLHACVPFYCIYEGCDQSFNDIDDLCRHTRRGHRGARRRAQHTPGLGPSLSLGTQYQLPTGEIEWPLALVSRSSISRKITTAMFATSFRKPCPRLRSHSLLLVGQGCMQPNRRPRELIDSCQFSFAQPSARTHGDGWNGKDEAKMAMRPLSNVDHSEIARLCRQGQVLFDDGDGMKDISSEDRDEGV
ncbi:hypothetical protein DL96DRAFT_921803 [Flagelloscypha sp. PMI_526]|nr:hypothetical protein DL96DRAFT_921803 [Flagelloscypha sp. PMI_526]